MFYDEVKNWDNPTETLVHKRQYKRKLHLTQPWNELKEGQVFLTGEFEVIGEKVEPEYFKTSPGQNNSLRIDNLRKFRDKVKRIYSDLLTRR